MKHLFPTSAILVGLFISAAHAKTQPETTPQNDIQVTLASEVDWTFLNPKRGALAPMAGTLWGDRSSKGATGFLLKPTDGFESPPHIHNVSYRGVVIRGVIHNDDPDAANMWMPPGSFWTQPKGEVHITAAQGGDSLAYIEIEEGPYLVLPSEEAFDSGERPVNVDHSNIVWLDAADIVWVDQGHTLKAANPAQVAFLWGSLEDGKLSGTFIKLPAGFTGQIKTGGTAFRAVVIQGQPKLINAASDEVQTLDPGSYIGVAGDAILTFPTTGKEATILYVRTDGPYEIVAN
ncbi:MAG: DUF4437 domain-containing protein [Puniceicoccales bacterium]